MVRNSIMIDIDDPRADKVAEVLANKTCKKILSVLAEQDMTAGEIANKLNLPLNTIGYNIDKLLEAELIEADKKFLWSVKGKRVYKYKVSNKRIVISPKIAPRGIVAALLVSVLGAIGIKIWTDNYLNTRQLGLERGGENLMIASEKAVSGVAQSSSSSGVVEKVSDSLINQSGSFASAPDLWAWFLFGALTVLLILIIFNWRKI